MGLTLFIFAAAIAINLLKVRSFTLVFSLCFCGVLFGVIKSFFLARMARRKVDKLINENPGFFAIIQPKLIITMMSVGLFLRYLGFDQLRLIVLLMVSIALMRSSFVYFTALKASEKSKTS